MRTVTVGNRQFLLVGEDVNMNDLVARKALGYAINGQYYHTPGRKQALRIGRGLAIEELLADGAKEVGETYPAYCSVCGKGLDNAQEAQAGNTVVCLECEPWASREHPG